MHRKQATSSGNMTRRWQRLRIDVPVRLIVSHQNGVKVVTGRIRDLSDEGIAVFAGVELAIDSEVSVEFTPSFNSPPLRAHSVVRNRRGYVYGLELLPRDANEELIVIKLKALLLPTGSLVDGSPADRR